MPVKEEGYDQFVTDCIQKGLEEYQAGKVVTLEQAKAHSKQHYEAYLNEQIRRGLADVEAGRVISQEDFLLEMEAFLANLKPQQNKRLEKGEAKLLLHREIQAGLDSGEAVAVENVSDFLRNVMDEAKVRAKIR